VKTRYPLLRALHSAGLNDFNVYRVAELTGVVRFPVFVRKIYGQPRTVERSAANAPAVGRGHVVGG